MSFSHFSLFLSLLAARPGGHLPTYLGTVNSLIFLSIDSILIAIALEAIGLPVLVRIYSELLLFVKVFELLDHRYPRTFTLHLIEVNSALKTSQKLDLH